MFLILLACLATALFTGCAKVEGKKKDSENTKKAARGADVKIDGYVGVIQSATLDPLKSNTIGDAFAGYRYFATKQWHESKTMNGTVVDFYGQLDSTTFSERDRSAGLAARTLDIKFVINDEGSFWIDSISRYDNKPGGRIESYTVADFGSVLPKIYANEVISF